MLAPRATNVSGTGIVVLSEVAVALQQTHVEYGVCAKPSWEIELVIQVSNLLHNCVWPDKTWQQLASTWERSYEIVRKVLNA